MKKIVSVLLTVILVCGFTIHCFAASYGDVKIDGSIDSTDALFILQASTGIITLTNEQKANANVDGNDKINSADALLVLSRAVGLIDVFPVEEGEEPDLDHGFIG